MTHGVWPPMFHFLKKYGIYVMRFFKDFGWKYVVIDDRLACKDGEILYGKCSDATELWVPMIEKGLAKIHNCYQALTSGDIGQGLADMTGMVAKKIYLGDGLVLNDNTNKMEWP